MAARLADVRVTPLGGGRQGDKGYGYGVPLRVDYTLDGAPRRAVVETVRPGPFGHEHMADRAQSLLWAHDAFRRLPRHVASLDVGAVRSSGALVPLGNAEELFMLAEFVEGARVCGRPAEAAGPARRFAPLDEARVRRAVRLPGRDPPRRRTGSGPLRAPHPRAGRPRRVHLRRGRQLPRSHGSPAGGDREEMRRLALEAEAPQPPPAPGARRLPSLEHHVPRRASTSACSTARAASGATPADDVDLPHAQLPLLLAAALGQARRRVRDACGGASGSATSSARATRELLEVAAPVLRVPRRWSWRTRSGIRRSTPACGGKLFNFISNVLDSRALRPGARERVLRDELRGLADRAFRLGQERHRARAGRACCTSAGSTSRCSSPT